MLGDLEVVRDIRHVIYLNGCVELACNALLDTVDREPAFAALAVPFEEERTQVDLN